MPATVSRLLLYPIKGCRGVSVQTAELVSTGLRVGGVGDREWIVVDHELEFLSQRELPRMALIETRLSGEGLLLSAPAMQPLEVPLASDGEQFRIRVWDDEIDAVTQGALADRWLSDFLGRGVRLMRFGPLAKRISKRKYTGATEAPFKFADAFAFLITSEASLADLNRRLRAKGEAVVDMDRFRPNIVLDGVEAFDEDYAAELRVGSAVLEVVKPCVRCTVPSVDPVRGEQGFEPGDTLSVYRKNKQAGGVTFGVNAIVRSGAGSDLRVGAPAELILRF
jgi:uncharacterized protein